MIDDGIEWVTGYKICCGKRVRVAVAGPRSSGMARALNTLAAVEQAECKACRIARRLGGRAGATVDDATQERMLRQLGMMWPEDEVDGR